MKTLSVDCDFAYPDGFALRAAFDVEPGITVVEGPSGGGKSTLVALIAGLLAPRQGTIEYRGRRFDDSEIGHRLPPHRRRVGVAFQDGRLFPHMSVRSNLLYGRRRFRTTSPSAADVIDALELRDVLRRRPDSLSGGQRQRVGLGRALLAGTDLLLLDEPVSALDGPLRDRVLEFVTHAVAQNRCTCLIVSHDRHVATRLAATGTILVENGQAVRRLNGTDASSMM